MKKIISLLVVFIMLLGLSACSADNAKKTSDTIIYGSGDYTRINPAMDEHGEINVLIFDGLTDHDGKNEIIPRLAESWEYDEASMTYTFHLAKNVKWHDGVPFSAEDVKFTIEAIMDEQNGSENAPNYEDVEEIRVIDEHTVSFRLSAPNYAFLEYMTMAILPKHLLEGRNMQEDEFFRAPVGTGPYKFVSWEKGQSIVLEKNNEYFAGPAKINKIIFKIVEDDNAKALQLQSGELNLAQVTPKDSENFKNKDGYRLYDMKTSDYRGILYNFWNEYWQKNADIIPAINYAVNREEILNAVILGYGEVGYGPLQRNVYNYDGVEKYSFDLAKSAAAFEAAGCTKDSEGFWTRNGERISFTINATPSDQVRIDMAQIVAQQLRAAGLDVKANVPAGGIDWGGQECCIIGWGSPFDADDHTYKVFGTDKGANYSGYSNELVDSYLTAARQTNVPAERAEAYKQFQIELAKTPAYTFFCYIDAMYVAENSIRGIDADTVLGHHGVGIFWNVCDWVIE